MALEPPRQFPLDFLIKFLSENIVNAKWPWSLQGSFLYISLLNPYSKAMQMALEPLRQFPLNFLIKSLFKSNAKWPWRI